MKLFIFVICFLMPLQETFKQKHLKFIRVKDAYSEKENTVKKYFLLKNLNYQGYNLYLRAFKQERILEVWVKEAASKQYSLLTQYDFCSSSGVPGPKRREGDGQIPEGFYHINHFNPVSNFHLSLGINYPNKSDKLLSDPDAPGSAIYIHGNCVTIGCIPVTDDKIKELYILAVEARNNGQQNIPVHIFPAKMNTREFADLQQKHISNTGLLAFWNNLQPGFQRFEESKEIPQVGVDEKGIYTFR